MQARFQVIQELAALALDNLGDSLVVARAGDVETFGAVDLMIDVEHPAQLLETREHARPALTADDGERSLQDACEFGGVERVGDHVLGVFDKLDKLRRPGGYLAFPVAARGYDTDTPPAL